MIFTPDGAIAEGAYAVQLIMEDFPRQNITLSNDVGKELRLTREDAIGQIPIQFVLEGEKVCMFEMIETTTQYFATESSCCK